MFKSLAAAILGSLAATLALAQVPDRPAAMFKHADADGDGLLSLDEFKSARTETFAKRDRNHDGYIDESDMPPLASARPKVRAAVEKANAKLDLDQNGKVTQKEFVDGAVPVFERADKNHDGMVDAKEREEFKGSVKERVQEMRKSG
ncbi:MAG: EF-hand domain-containing protein [Steroidobacteraceae bacterium]